MKRALTLTAAMLAVLLLSASAGAGGDTGWVIEQSSGDTFSGTFTNTTASPINGIAVGTADKAGNPITSFEIDGIACGLYAAYGSAYCYTGLIIPPGHTVHFSGTAKSALTPAGLQMCSSADKGMDNTCVDVAISGGSDRAAIEQKAAATLLENLDSLIAEESTAASQVEKGERQAAIKTLLGASKTLSALRNLSVVHVLPSAAQHQILDDLRDAVIEDNDALHGLYHGGSNAQVHGHIEDAMTAKRAAAHVTQLLAH